MSMVIVRNQRTQQRGCFGRLFFNGLELHTGELSRNDNKPFLSRIPAGTYKAKRHKSPRFGDCILIKDVPNRSNILIHVGNYCSVNRTDTQGCILVGLSRHDSFDMVCSSRRAMASLMKKVQALGDFEFNLIIVEAF